MKRKQQNNNEMIRFSEITAIKIIVVNGVKWMITAIIIIIMVFGRGRRRRL